MPPLKPTAIALKSSAPYRLVTSPQKGARQIQYIAIDHHCCVCRSMYLCLCCSFPNQYFLFFRQKKSVVCTLVCLLSLVCLLWLVALCVCVCVNLCQSIVCFECLCCHVFYLPCAPLLKSHECAHGTFAMCTLVSSPQEGARQVQNITTGRSPS